MTSSENLDDLLGSQVVDDANEKTSNDKNWLQKATSNVIQQVKATKKGSSDENELDDSIIVPTPITSILDDTQIAQDQKLWGMSSASSSATTTTATVTTTTNTNTDTNINNNDVTISSYNSNSKQAENTPLAYDNFSFSPPPNFIPISSCDELEPLPTTMLRDFNDKKSKGTGGTTNELKISANFSKLIANSKKVDLVRNAKRKAAVAATSKKGKEAQERQQQQPSSEFQMITSSKEADEYLKRSTLQATTSSLSSSSTSENISSSVATVTATLTNISVQKAQQNLIEQLKQGIDFLTNQNKHLSSHGDALEQQIAKERKEFLKLLADKKKEVEERNIKLAALEQHFMALNNPGNDTSLNDNTAASGTTSTSTSTATTSEETQSEAKDAENDNESTSSPKKTVKTSVSSSIVQIDKGYLNDLELTVKLQKQALEKFESENKTLKTNVSKFTAELEKKERTITNLESTLKQGREARFSKKSKSHRRRSTESVIISTGSVTQGGSAATTSSGPGIVGQSDDEFSISNASGNATTTGVSDKVDVENAIANAVDEALTKQKEDHQVSIEVLSQQLDLKDKIIQRHEMKIYSLINDKKSDNSALVRQRQVPQDVMIRNISVTNELMDTSIRKLEKMMDQLELVEKEKRTDLADEISPIRRVATKVSLVHEEMKVAIKLIEQKVANDVEMIKQASEQKHGNNDEEKEQCEDGESGQTSGEGDNTSIPHTMSSSVDDQIAEVLSASMKALKETEGSVKKQIDELTEQLQKIEFELAGKQDTIEALELACSEHVENCRKLHKEIEELKLGMMQV